MWHTMQKAIKGTSSLNDGEVRLPLHPTMIESAGENKPENHQVSTLETCGGERSSMRSWVSTVVQSITLILRLAEDDARIIHTQST